MPDEPLLSDEPGAWPLNPGVTLWNVGCESGGSKLAACSEAECRLCFLRLLAFETSWASEAFEKCMLSNGTCTTTKPGRGAPLNQPAPPPGLADVVPK